MKLAFAFPLRHLHWWLGLGILVLVGVVLCLRWLERRRRGRLERFVEADLAPRLLVGFDEKVRRPLFWLTALGAVFLLIAFAQPRWGQAWLEVQRSSRDILICLDTSESMRATNPLPNRLERAKQKVVSLLDRAPGDRFGLIAFSGAAELQCPLTSDTGYFRSVISAVDTDTISMEGTDIADAIETATRVFKEDAEKTGDFAKDSKAILVISDGEQVSGDAVEAAEEAAQYARVYVIGVGDPHGAEVEYPEWMARYKRVKEKTHLSRLDESMLERVAVTGKGGYSRSTANNDDINDIYEIIGKYQARNVGSDIRFRLVNRYQWFLAAAIALFAAEGFWLSVVPWFRKRQLREEGSHHA